MSTDLERFGEHARAMSTRHHKDGCPAVARTRGQARPDRHACDGCITDADRALWARLADEVDQYLAPPEEEPTLDGTDPLVPDYPSVIVVPPEQYARLMEPDYASDEDVLAAARETSDQWGGEIRLLNDEEHRP